MSTKAVFGGAIACLLLVIYVWLVSVAISVLGCEPAGCQEAGFNQKMAAALALIGGLVSALVIAELAITKPGQPLLARAFVANPGARAALALKIVTFTYLGVWILAGLAAFLFSLQYENAHQPLVDLGQSWLGLAVAGAYAYFGIK
jgi:hypothetical protein